MTDINVGAITEALNDKTDRDLQNVDTTAKADAVIDFQLPTAENNYTWYRKYKSGWVEQGGTWTGSWTVGNGSQGTQNITLPVEMRDGEYHPLLNFFNMIWIFYGTQNLTTTDFSVIAGGYNNNRTITKFNWQVSGMSAS